MSTERADYVRLYHRTLSRPSQRWRWRRIAPNGEILSQSSEGYRSKSHALAMARRCNSGLLVLDESEAR